MSEANFARPFVQHGIVFQGKNSKGDSYAECPFCNKSGGHFSVNESTGKWGCFKCNRKGNLYTFLREWYDKLCDEVGLDSSKDGLNHRDDFQLSYYDQLVADRKLKAQTFARFGVVWSPLIDKWIIPVLNLNGKLADLLMYQSGSKLVSTALCQRHLFRGHTISSPENSGKPVYICEGEWDVMAFDQMARTIKIKGEKWEDKICYVGTPGAAIMKPEWCSSLSGRKIILLYDNDKQGKEGMESASKKLDSASEIHTIKWEEDKPNKYDIRDMIVESSKNLDAYRYINTHLESVKTGGNVQVVQDEQLKPIPCTSWKDLVQSLRETLYFPKSLEHSFAVMMAIVVSTPMRTTEQLWGRFFGTPGSGKSTLSSLIASAPEFAYSIDRITGAVSGWRSGQQRNQDTIELANGKTIVVHDADPMMKSSQREQIEAEFRTLYGGHFNVDFKNGVKIRHSNMRHTIILCGTDDLRDADDATLGARFLGCELVDETHSHETLLNSVFDNTMGQMSNSFQRDSDHVDKRQMQFLKRKTYGYLLFLRDQIKNLNLPSIDQRYREQIKAMAGLIAKMRVKPKRDRSEELTVRPRAELPSRLVGQLPKLAVCLAVVLNKINVDDEVMEIEKKICRDTIDPRSFRFNIVHRIYTERTDFGTGLTTRQIEKMCNISWTTVKRQVRDMLELRLITNPKVPNNKGTNRNLHSLVLTDSIVELIEKSRIFESET